MVPYFPFTDLLLLTAWQIKIFLSSGQNIKLMAVLKEESSKSLKNVTM